MTTYLTVGYFLDLDEIPDKVLRECKQDNNVFHRQPLIKLVVVSKDYYILGAIIGEINSSPGDTITCQKLDGIVDCGAVVTKIVSSKLPNVRGCARLIMFELPNG